MWCVMRVDFIVQLPNCWNRMPPFTQAETHVLLYLLPVWAANFDSSITLTSHSIRTSPVLLHDRENIGYVWALEFQWCLQAGIWGISDLAAIILNFWLPLTSHNIHSDILVFLILITTCSCWNSDSYLIYSWDMLYFQFGGRHIDIVKFWLHHHSIHSDTLSSLTLSTLNCLAVGISIPSRLQTEMLRSSNSPDSQERLFVVFSSFSWPL